MDSSCMNALLLSGGYGTRLRPLTDIWPKCLMPIDGIPLMEYWLHELKSVGVKKVIVNTHYQADLVQGFIDQAGYGDWVSVIYEDELLGTAGTLWNNQKFFESEPLYLIHADNYCRCNFQSFQNHHQRFQVAGIVGTMMTFHTDTPITCGIVETDSSETLIKYYEKVSPPQGNIANAAVFILENSIFDLDENIMSSGNDFCRDIVPNLIGKISTWHNDKIHLDIGSLEKISEAQDQIYERLDVQLTPWHIQFNNHPIHRKIEQLK